MNTAEERAEAAAIDVEGRQARIAEILNGDMIDKPARTPHQFDIPVKDLVIPSAPRPARAKRKDAGHPRPKKAEPAAQVAGVLSQEQVERIKEHMLFVTTAKVQLERAQDTCEQYLDSLVSK